MLEQNASVFFMYADGILDCLTGTGAVDEVGVHVVNGTFAVAAQG